MNDGTMPHIPSSMELGYMGSMQKADGASQQTSWGRYGDTELVHAAQGEVMVPPEVIDAYPELGQIISEALSSMGADPNRYVVGGQNNSLNPYTGQPEFFLKSIGKLFKGITKSGLGKMLIPIAASFALPGIGTALGASISAPMGAAIGSGLATKLSGGSWGQALGAGAGSYLGSNIGLGGIEGTVGSTLSSIGLDSLGSMLPSALSSAALSTIGGAYLGSSIGESLGGIIDPPDVSWGNEFANFPTLSQGSSSTLPNPNVDPALEIPGASTDGSAPSKGIGVNPNIPTVNYLTNVKDRNTGQEKTVNTTFGSNFNTDRRNSWGGVAFA